MILDSTLRPLFALLFLPTLSLADSGTRILELSTRGIPLNGEIRFQKQATQIGSPIPILGERYIWKPVPEGATEFVVVSLSTSSSPVSLFPDGNTFATINPTQPIDPATGTSGVPLARLPLVQTPVVNLPPAAPATSGWVFVGSLSTASETSDWKSLYILNPGDLRRPDSQENFTYQSLKQRISSADAATKTFIVDFPLNLRPQPGGTEGASLPRVRPGQKIKMSELQLTGTSVYAKVTVE